MIQYTELVQYTKDNHINWNTDIFDVLKGFFDNYYHQPTLPPQQPPSQPIKQIFKEEPFKEPDDGEYTQQDLFNLFST